MKKETDMSTYVEIGKRRKKQWPKLKAREGGLFYLVSLDQTSYPVCTKFFSTQRKTAQTKVQYIYKVWPVIIHNLHVNELKWQKISVKKFVIIISSNAKFSKHHIMVISGLQSEQSGYLQLSSLNLTTPQLQPCLFKSLFSFHQHL